MDGVASERLEMARRGIEAHNGGGFEALAALLHDDVVAVVPAGLPNEGVYRGPDGFAHMMAHWGEAWEDFRVEIEELTEEGDAVLAQVTQRGRGRGSGIETTMRAVHLIRFRDGRVLFWRLCADLAEARSHIGGE
jgi:ketosteroid isomerase-like protein